MAAPYKPLEAIQLLRPAFRSPRRSPHPRIAKAFSTSRPSCATHSSTASSSSSSSSAPPPPSEKRRSVTITNDTGAVRWGDLSIGEKAARTTQQSFNFAIIIVGVALTGAVGYFLFTDVLSPSSKTAYFNRATTRIRSDPACRKLLGASESSHTSAAQHEISAHGEPSYSRWARNRQIASSTETDKWGTEHLRFKFYVEGPKPHGRDGVVHVHLTKRRGQDEFEYALLALDVKGEKRLYLENASERKDSKVAPKIFGARWW